MIINELNYCNSLSIYSSEITLKNNQKNEES